MKRMLILIATLVFLSCSRNGKQNIKEAEPSVETIKASNLTEGTVEEYSRPIPLGQNEAKTVFESLAPLAGFDRIKAALNSFGAYVQAMQITDQLQVRDYQGNLLSDNQCWAVLSTPDITANQQCADICYRFNAEWKKANKKDIQYTHVSGAKKVYKPEQNFEKYLLDIYAYSNTASLLQYDSKAITLKEAVPGDILVTADTSPGHALLVADILQKDGKYWMAFIQGYIPAQTPHIVLNENTPYFEVDKELYVNGFHFAVDRHLRRMK